MTRKRRLWILIAVALILSMGALLAQTRVPGVEVTRAQRVELVDKDGRIRAEVKTIGDDTVLALYDGRGRLRTLVGTDSIVFYGVDGQIARRIDARQAPAEESR